MISMTSPIFRFTYMAHPPEGHISVVYPPCGCEFHIKAPKDATLNRITFKGTASRLMEKHLRFCPRLEHD